MKKDIKTIPLLCLLIFTITMLGGCGTTEAGVSKTQTDFSIVDEQGKVVKYLTADNDDVVKVKEVAEGLFKAMNNRSYESLKGDEEYGYYTEALIKVLKEKNDQANTVNGYRENQLVTTDAGMDKFTVKFDTDGTTCTITVTSKTTIASATDAYLKAMNIASKGTIGCDYTLGFIKSADVWRVNKISANSPYALK